MHNGNRPHSDPAQGQRAYSAVIKTELLIQAFLGNSLDLTVARIGDLPEVLIFPRQVRAVRDALRWCPGPLMEFEKHLHGAFTEMPLRAEAVLEVCNEWKIQSLAPRVAPGLKWSFPLLFEHLSMESRCFLARIQLSKRSGLLLTTDPIERVFAEQILGWRSA